MTEQAPFEIICLQRPTQCLLWEHPDRILIGRTYGDWLEAIESYEDSRHLTRSLYQCRECGQQAEIEALKQTDCLLLLSHFPRLQFDGGIGWVG